MTAPARAVARVYAPLFEPRWLPGSHDCMALRMLQATCNVVALAGLTHERPPFGIDKVTVRQREAFVSEDIVERTPFCTLLHFRKSIDLVQPRVLIVAPASGHFSTLLRGTVEALLPDHEVYITDWTNAREVPLSDELLTRLRAFWKQHRNPEWMFPAPGRGWMTKGTMTRPSVDSKARTSVMPSPRVSSGERTAPRRKVAQVDRSPPDPIPEWSTSGAAPCRLMGGAPPPRAPRHPGRMP